MSIQTWAERARSSSQFQDPENQLMIHAFESFLTGDVESSEVAAQSITKALQPVIDLNPSDPRVISVWSLFCDVVRVNGVDQQTSKRLVALLNSIRKIEVRDENGAPIQYAWGGSFWRDMPAFGMMFREYAMEIDAFDGMDVKEWLAQAKPLLNATHFAATALASNEDWDTMAFYVPGAMQDMCNAMDESDEPEPRYRLTMFVPVAASWISLAGAKIYAMCKKDEYAEITGVQWETWKSAFKTVAAESTVDNSLRNIAREAHGAMNIIEDSH